MTRPLELNRFAADGLMASTPEGPVLLGSRCVECGDVRFPRPHACPACTARGDRLVVHPLSRRGRIFAATQVHRAPDGFKVPFWLAWVQLDHGPRVLAQLEGEVPEDPSGEAAELVLGDLCLDEDGVVRGYKFELLVRGRLDGAVVGATPAGPEVGRRRDNRCAICSVRELGNT